MAALDAGKLGRAPGAETGSRGGGRRLVCEAHGREESQQRAQASGEAAHGSARRVRRRGASTAVLGVRARRWRRVERPRGFGRLKTGRDEGTARGRRPGLGRRPRLSQHRTEEGERRESERLTGGVHM